MTAADNGLHMGASERGENGGNHDVYHMLHKSADEGDLETINKVLNDNPDALMACFPPSNDRALHVAALAGHVKVVERLVMQMEREDLALRNDVDFTALHYAAGTGIKEMAECMVEKNPDLVSLPGQGLLPVLFASLDGHKCMASYLYDQTPKAALSPVGGHAGATLLTSSIRTDAYELVWKLLEDHPDLVFARDWNAESALMILARKPSAFRSGSSQSFWQRWIYSCICVQLPDDPNIAQRDIGRQGGQSVRKNMIIQLFNKLGGLVWNLIIVVPIIKHIYDTKLEHLQALKLLRKILASLQKSDNSTLLEEEVGASYAMSDAVKNGIVEFVCEIVKYLPANMWRTDEDDRDIFLNAIVHRQENIFSLLYGLGALKYRFVTSHDKFGNNMLHLAGMLAPPCRLDRVSGAALQLQRELQWFKGVEDMVPPVCRVEENEGGKKPRTLFTEQHVDLLKAGEKWMKSTAKSCMLVATLIATVMFSATLTTPGGTDQKTGIPLLLDHKYVRVFVISNAVSLYSSTTSVLMFLAILTSRHAEEDFLKSLPQKLIIGLSTLFLSMATMMTAYAAALATLYTQGLRWSTSLISSTACIPVSLFVFLQFPLLVEIFNSTYGTGIFNTKSRRWSY